VSRDPQVLPGRALAVAGGPLGRHASVRAASWLATLVPLLAATAGTMALSVVQRAHCIQQGWSGSDQFWHGCFSDLPALYQLGNLDDGLGSYLTEAGARSDHPVLSGAVMALLGGLVPDGPFLDQTRWYVALWALLASTCALAIVWLTAASRPRHVAAAAQVALSPVLLLTALLSSDVVGVLLVSAGIFAWARRRPVVAGVLLGLGVAARTYPLLVLLVLVLLGVRTGRTAAVGRALAGAGVAVAVVLLPFLVGNPGAILRTYQVWWDSTPGLGSLWMVPQLVGLPPVPGGMATLLTVSGTVLALLVGAVFVLGTTRRPTVAEAALVLVALTLLVGKAFPVQSSLWLVPLVALCGLRWRDHLVWAVPEVLHFAMVWLYVAGLSTPDRGLPAQWYAFFLLLRLAGVAWLVVRVWQQAGARAEAPDPAYLEADTGPEAGGEGAAQAEPDPDSDAVVDELAGDFTDAPDLLLVRLT
jgi:hypothetical protein